MALMAEKLYSALRAGEVPDQLARDAAIEAAEHESDMAEIKANLSILKWATGINTAGILALLAMVANLLLRVH